MQKTINRNQPQAWSLVVFLEGILNQSFRIRIQKKKGRRRRHITVEQSVKSSAWMYIYYELCETNAQANTIRSRAKSQPHYVPRVVLDFSSQFDAATQKFHTQSSLGMRYGNDNNAEAVGAVGARSKTHTLTHTHAHAHRQTAVYD